MNALQVHSGHKATQQTQQPRQQAIIQPRLMVNAPGDRYEQEADAMADRVMRMQDASGMSTGMIGKSVQRKCHKCEEEEKKKRGAIMRKKTNGNEQPVSFSSTVNGNYLQRKCALCEEEEKKKKNGMVMRKAEAGAGFEAPADVSSQLIHANAGGSPLPDATRSFMENAFSTDFSRVRIHTDSSAAAMNKQVNAKAFTYGNNIYFGSGQFAHESSEGKRLLAHELTHVVQQSGAGMGIPGITRQENKTIYRQPDFKVVSENIHQGNIQSVENLLGLPPDTIPAAALTNPEFLLSFINQSGNASAKALLEINNIPDGIAGLLPENQVVEVSSAELMGLPGNTENESGIMHDIGGVLHGVNATVDHHLAHFGYNSAGPNSIGIVAFPQSRLVRGLTGGSLLTPGPLLPESRILLGHTAVYVRINGQISVIKSYAPVSLIEAATNFGKVRGGTGGVPAQIVDHLGQAFPPGGNMFEITSGQSIEYPVSETVANRFAKSLPEGGSLPGELYTAQPEIAAQLKKVSLCNGKNCVYWAVKQVEKEIGEIKNAQGQSVLDAAGKDSARQGKLQSFLSERPSPPNPGNGENPIPVRGQMSPTIKILKIGSRIFEVASIGYSVYKIVDAPSEHRGEVIGEEGGGIGGGYLGAEAGVAGCIAFGLATEGIGLLICGIGGGYLGSKAGSAIFGTIGGLYDLIAHPEEMKKMISENIRLMGDIFTGIEQVTSAIISAPFELLTQNLVKTTSEYDMANWDMRYVPDIVQADLHLAGKIISDSLQNLRTDDLITILTLPVSDLGLTPDIAGRLVADMQIIAKSNAGITVNKSLTTEDILKMNPIAFMDFMKSFRLAFIQDPVFIAKMEGRYQNEMNLRVSLFPLIMSRAYVNIYNWDLSDIPNITMYGDDWTLHDSIETLGSIVWEEIRTLSESEISDTLNFKIAHFGIPEEILQEIVDGLNINHQEKGGLLSALFENTDTIKEMTPKDFIDFLINFNTGFKFKYSPYEVANTSLQWVKSGFAPW